MSRRRAGGNGRMADDRLTAELRVYYAHLIDPDETRHDVVHEEKTRIAYADLRYRLAQRFATEPAVRGIQLVVAGRPLGVVTPDRTRDPGRAGPGDLVAVGAGERASQPGQSSRYRAVRFQCQPPCPNAVVLPFYDERFVPHCDGHGEM